MFLRFTYLLFTVVIINISFAQDINEKYDSLKWNNGLDLSIGGKGWNDSLNYYGRLPFYAENIVTERVWEYQKCTSGFYIDFVSDATSILIKYTLTKKELALPNMPATGASAFDLYGVNSNGEWTFLDNSMPENISDTVEFFLGNYLEYKLYFPLYNGLDTMLIGVPKNKAFSQRETKFKEKPIVFYGTSITQGGCVSRPGMSATSMVSRKLNIPVINLGFSGAGKMEVEMAAIIAELDPSIFVIDCLWNMTEEMVETRVMPFVVKLRENKPNVPIILVEDSNYLNITPTAKGNVLREKIDILKSKGTDEIYFLSNKNMLGKDGEGTVDGVHPNDLGMMLQANIFVDYLAAILNKTKNSQ